MKDFTLKICRLRMYRGAFGLQSYMAALLFVGFFVFAHVAARADAPAVVAPPEFRIVKEGADFVFHVTASGSEPLFYQWRHNGTNLPGASGSALPLTNIQFSDRGAYSVRITNSAGGVTSEGFLHVTKVTPGYIAEWDLNGGWDRARVRDSQTVRLWNPAPIEPGRYVAVSAGNGQTVGLKDNGAIFGFGAIRYPFQIPASNWTPPRGNTIDVISDASYTATDSPNFRLKFDGTVVGFGYGSTSPWWLTNVVALAGGAYHNLALLKDGTVVSWGGMTNVPAGLDHVVGIAAGFSHSLALKSDGTVVQWNSNGTVQPLPVEVHDFTVITASRQQSLGLKADGTLVAWNLNGTLATVPLGLTNIISIAGKFEDFIALRDDGKVLGWGYYSGRIPKVQSALNGVVAIAAGLNHAAAITIAPFIERHPTNQIANAGTTVTFELGAAGNGPLSFQWQFNGEAIANATNSTLILENVLAANEGSYSVVISNNWGAITSRSATLTVVDPVIAMHPLSQIVLPGSNVVFVAAANGTAPLAYHWQKNGTDLSDGGNVSGTQTATLHLDNVTDADNGTYSVFVSNPISSAVSSGASLIVTDPVVTTQPASQTVAIGAPATLTTTVIGTGPFTYQWRFNGTNIVGATNESLSFDALRICHSGRYDVVITGPAGVAVSSNAVLSVDADIMIGFRGHVTDLMNDDAVVSGVSVGKLITGTYTYRSTTADVDADPNIGDYRLAVRGEEPHFGITAKIGTYTFQSQPGDVNFAIGVYNQPEGDSYSVYSSLNVCSDERLYVPNIGFNFSGDGSIFESDALPLRVPNLSGAISDFDVVGRSQNDGRSFQIIGVIDSIFPVNPVISTRPQLRTITAGMDTTFIVAAVGQGELQYQWQCNGFDIPGAKGTNYSVLNAQVTATGNYSVIVTDLRTGASVTNLICTLTVVVDSNRPTISIASPPNNLRTIAPQLTVQGTASDNVRVARVVYTLNNGPQTDAVGTTNWSAVLDLVPGTNIFKVKSIDNAGLASAQLTRTFFRVVTNVLTMQSNGPGSIVNTNGILLEVGRAYRIAAIPDFNAVFVGWSGDIVSTDPRLQFIMRSNMVLTANFITNPFISAGGAYNGLFYDTNEIAHHNSGFFSGSVSRSGTMSGKLLFGGDTVSFSGRVNLDGTFMRTIVRSNLNKADVTINVALDYAGDVINGTISTTNWAAQLLAHHAVFNLANPATNVAGRYTMLIPGFADSAQGPAGDGYATIAVDARGRITCSGALSDRSPLRSTVPVSKQGDWPFYMPLYAGNGSVLGWLSFSSNSVSGTVNWIKLAGTNSFYPAGFTNRTEVLGSAYAVPTNGDPVLIAGSASVELSGGNLAAPLLVNASVTNNLVRAGTLLNVAIAPSTGLVKGDFYHPNLGTRVSIVGALVQQQNRIGGSFLGTNEGGLFHFDNN